VLRDDGRILVTGDQRALRGLDPFERDRLVRDVRADLSRQRRGQRPFPAAHRCNTSRPGRAELGVPFMNLRSAGVSLPAFDAGLFAYALGLANWQARTRYCANCAAAVAVRSGRPPGKVY
jgi:NAD+ diphosphatase